MSERGERATAPGIAWRRAARGLTFIGIGVFLLLNTTGRLPWSFWGDLLDYWPVLLVAIGIRMVFDKSAAPWLVLLGPVLSLATMTWVAVIGTGQGAPSGEPVPMQIARPAEATSWTLDAHLAFAALNVTARDLAPSVLVEGTTRSASGRSMSYGRSGADDKPRAWLRSRHFQVVWPGRRIGVTSDLRVADDLPLALDLDLAFMRTVLDLARAHLARLSLDGAFNDLEVRLGRPEVDAQLTFDGAFSRYRIVVPADVPVQVDEDGPFHSVDGRRGERSGPGYRVRVAGAFTRVEVLSE